MSYSTRTEVRDMVKDDALNAIIGDTFIEDPAEREELVSPIIDAAIADADAEIDGYSDLSDMEFGEMFSAGISDAVRAFKTSGSGMAQAIQNLGASATTAQVPLEEQLSVLGMLQATMGGAEAGTKYKAFLRSATKGGEALGLKFTDANNQLLSMPEILDILRGKFGETMDAAEKMELQKAFGDTEAVALIDLMYNKVGDLQDNIVNMYGSLGKGVSVTEQMASAIQETEPERFERLKQRIHNVTESIGNSLLPTVNDLMSKGEGVLTKVGSWIEKNQELVKVIMLIVLAVGGFLAVGGTLIALISGVGLVVTKTVSAFKILKGGFALARGALTPLISSVWSFTAALLANPVTWVVIGIVALIAALVLRRPQWKRKNCTTRRSRHRPVPTPSRKAWSLRSIPRSPRIMIGRRSASRASSARSSRSRRKTPPPSSSAMTARWRTCSRASSPATTMAGRMPTRSR